MCLQKQISFICLLIFWVSLEGQQLPVYSMYMMNAFVINPAVAGSDGYTTVGLSSRDQMLGIENSPRTNVLSIQGRIMRSSVRVKRGILSKERLSRRSGRVGIGGYLFNDKNGAIQRTGGSFSYAYHIFFQNTQLSFGIAATTFQFKISQTDLKFGSNNEPTYNQSYSNRLLIPDVTTGMYILTPTSFFGLSIANMFQTRLNIGNDKTYDYRMYRHYFLMAGKRFNENDTYSYEPSFLLKATEKMVAQADLQMRFYYKQDYYLGLSYRTGSSAGLLLGIKWKKMYLGYAFDYGFTSIQKYSFGAHEVNLALKLGDNARRYHWLIRY